MGIATSEIGESRRPRLLRCQGFVLRLLNENPAARPGVQVARASQLSPRRSKRTTGRTSLLGPPSPLPPPVPSPPVTTAAGLLRKLRGSRAFRNQIPRFGEGRRANVAGREHGQEA